MQQVFVHDFVHADPHPGNLFVNPLPAADDEHGEPPPGAAGRPFQLVYVDFGMMAVIPHRLRAALREALFGLGTRDAERVVHAAQAAGLLLPGADIRRLIEVHEDLFQRFWGVRIGEVREVALSEARYFFRQYRDLLFEMPFQVQVDLLYVSRAVGLVAGLTTSLDPEFDPWAETMPFAERLAGEELGEGAKAWLRLFGEQAAVAVRLPEKVDRVLSRAERGGLEMQVTLAPEARRPFERLERSTHRLGWTVAAAALFVSGTILRSGEPPDPVAPWLWAAAALAFLWGVLRGR
jgi:predicted unusual protein kinase regulating ubiquinone biosynthesis (AarF/ABC1/UbiB family)